MAIIFGLLGILFWVYYIVVDVDDVLFLMINFMVGICCTFIGLILGSISIGNLIEKKGNAVLHTVSILVISVSVLMAIYSICYLAIPQVRMLRRGANMAEITIALEVYMQKHSGELPVTSTWCDLLVNDQYLTSSQLTTASKDKVQRGYALNADAVKYSEMPDDIVLIFESVPGWNLVGGKELLVRDNYKGGCYVLFGDVNTRYINLEDIDNLRWE